MLFTARAVRGIQHTTESYSSSKLTQHSTYLPVQYGVTAESLAQYLNSSLSLSLSLSQL